MRDANLSMTECSHYFPQRACPCIEAIQWHCAPEGGLDPPQWRSTSQICRHRSYDEDLQQSISVRRCPEDASPGRDGSFFPRATGLINNGPGPPLTLTRTLPPLPHQHPQSSAYDDNKFCTTFTITHNCTYIIFFSFLILSSYLITVHMYMYIEYLYLFI